MKVSELKTEMDGRFAAVDQALEVLRQRIDERIRSEGETTRRDFDERIKSEAETTRRDFDERIKSEAETTRRDFDERIKSEGETTRRYFDGRIKSEGETTRRYFDVVAEKMLSERNLGLDRSMATAQQLAGLTASNAADHVRIERRLDEHERRLDTIERGRAPDPV
jgi:hypothetical protein